jgi:hypothetical protein
MKKWSIDLLVVAAIFLAYATTIRLAMHADYAGSLLAAAANTVPVVIFGAAVRHIIQRRLARRHAGLQLLAHLPLCAAFATLSYGLLIVLLGLFNGPGPSGFVVQPLSASGTVWQSLENVTTYALIAAMSYLQAQPAGAAAPASVADLTKSELTAAQTDALAVIPPDEAVPAIRAEAAPSRYFVKIGDELRPLDIETVVSIGGADDYSEVCTLAGKHLVRVTLAEFGKSLDPARYVRVHRSWIVNVHRIARAEPAGGGRLLLHMETGQVVSTSRNGARLLRDRVI